MNSIKVACTLCALALAAHGEGVTLALLGEFAGFLQNVLYPGIQELLGDSKSWETLGYACTYAQKGRFHSWEWEWTGTVDCPNLGQWQKGDCKSRGCAFKGAMRPYLTKLASTVPAAARPQLIQTVQTCCGFSPDEQAKIISAINAV